MVDQSRVLSGEGARLFKKPVDAVLRQLGWSPSPWIAAFSLKLKCVTISMNVMTRSTHFTLAKHFESGVCFDGGKLFILYDGVAIALLLLL